jgi:hypothetical protein
LTRKHPRLVRAAGQTTDVLPPSQALIVAVKGHSLSTTRRVTMRMMPQKIVAFCARQS